MPPAIAELTEALDDELKAVHELFETELHSDIPSVAALVKHVGRFRGKMLRPMLVLLAGRAAGETSRDHVVLATVVEMVHMATLVHDDVLDEAELRRRGATINHLRGNEAAVLLGDYLISHSYHLCSSLGSQEVSREIAATTNRVCEGELLQLDHRNNLDLDEETYFQIIALKTAALTATCAKLGALLAGASETVARAFETYGLRLGQAFQVQDDVLDLVGETHVVGKTLGIDLEKGKLTLPLIHFMSTAPAEHRALLRSLLKSREPDLAERVRHLVLPSGSIDYARNRALALVDDALDAMSVCPPSDARSALEAMARMSVSRSA